MSASLYGACLVAVFIVGACIPFVVLTAFFEVCARFRQSKENRHV